MKSKHTNRERLQAVLEFWHRIEFFIPFDLSARAEEQEGRASFWLHAENIEDDMADARRPIVPSDKEVAGIKVFFGVFDKSEMVESVRRFCQPGDELSEFEDFERADLEGDTCFASLDLDATGAPVFSGFSVSTLPWALGRIRNGDLSALSSTAFEESKLRLKELLSNFAQQRRLSQAADVETPQPLTAAEMLDLHNMLQRWSGFQPRPGRPVALVEIRFRDVRKQQVLKQLDAPKIVELSPEEEGIELDDDDDHEAAVEYEIGILNSFYLEDLERAIAVVRAGDIPEALRQYLTPIAADERVDLYSEEGRRAILERLHPRHLNRGRWPSAPRHAMSLMQQFAINVAGEMPEDGGLFSVNGPPGTGKTTLLRDVIADNIVKRARVLASLRSPRSAFDGPIKKITFADGKPGYVYPLKSDLTGFEMVVASSNNAAVENISRDLPKRGSLGEQSRVEYLQSVAHNVAAQTEKGSFARLEAKDQPWGLIACVLGNSTNRWTFNRAFYQSLGKEKRNTAHSNGNLFQNIRGWLSSYQGPSFSQAAEAFRAADAAVEATLARYSRYADLYAEVGLVSQEEYCRTALSQRQQSAELLQTVERLYRDGMKRVDTAETDFTELKEEERLLDRTAPAWWYTVLPTRTGRQHRQAKARNAQAQLALKNQQQMLKLSLKNLRSNVDTALEKLEKCEALLKARNREWSLKSDEFVELGASLGNPALPVTLDDLEADRFQIDGLWHSEELAAQRSDLFSAALNLHAAWLAEVGPSNGGFGGNIFAATQILSGNLPVDHDVISAIWQSFFMIVPVVSTTFASFARQFYGVKPGELGWLFVDEAGQAVPQAAVGGLMRANHVMVIGDPLQIEPVFTLSSSFIEALASISAYTANGEYSPTQVSVQTLADTANKYGTAVPAQGDESLWIGSPLRVHRRCIDPMFSLSNRIAYQGKMVFAAGEQSPSADVAPFYGHSTWIDIKGQVSGKQTVAQQVAFILDVLRESVKRDGDLPALYVISPFKETKAVLKREIERATWVGRDNVEIPPPKKLKEWLKRHVGTVHTFQGKEENAVFMVLGTDASRRGAAKWAASKPNLLNVAVTRARYRIYVVGDRDLWRGQQYFSEAAEALQSVQAADFLTRFRA